MNDLVFLSVINLQGLPCGQGRQPRSPINRIPSLRVVRTRVCHALALRITNITIVDLIAPVPTELFAFAFGVSQNKDLIFYQVGVQVRF